MKRWICLTITVCLYANSIFSQSNVNISNYAFSDTEPCLAVNPLNSNNLVAAWMKLTGFQLSIAVSYSNNGGNSWSTPVNMPHLYAGFSHADPSLAFNDSGKAYLCFIDYTLSKDSGYVMVCSSTNGGMAWSTPVQVFSWNETPDFPVDRPWIAADNSNGIYNGTLYVTSKSVDIGALPHHIWLKSSQDGGLTWSAIKLIDDSIPSQLITNSMGVPTVGADGNLYIAYASWLSLVQPANFICVKSTDGGNSFTPYTIAQPVAGSSITDTLYQGSYCLSANPADSNNLIFIATDARLGDPDILAVSSANGGITWATNPVRVNDDAINNGAGQDMCWGAFSPNGIYACAWRDRRNGGAGSLADFEIFVALSSDGGLSFSSNQNLSAQPSPVIPITKGNDFLGVCMDNNSVFTDWSDARTGNNEIFSGKDSVAVILSTRNFKDEHLFLNVFPNPAHTEITVEIKTKDKSRNEIFIADLTGRTVWASSKKISSGKTILYVNTLPAGVYFVVLKTNNTIYRKYFVKN